MSALGSLVVQLALEYAQYTQGLDKSSQEALKFAQKSQKSFDQAGKAISDYATSTIRNLALTGAAYLGVSSVIDKISYSIDQLSKLDDLSQKTGSAVETLSRLLKVQQQFGGDESLINTSLNKLAKGMATVDSETSKSQKALAALGLSARDSAGKLRDPSEVLIDVAKKLQDYKDGAGKAALATDLFGKSGAELLPYLNDVADNVDKFTGVSAQAHASASAFQDRMGGLKIKSNELFTAIAIDLIPTLDDLIDNLTGVNTQSDNIARNKSIQEWANTVATNFAAVADNINNAALAYHVLQTSIGAGGAIVATILNPKLDYKETQRRVASIKQDAGSELDRLFKSEDYYTNKLNARRSSGNNISEGSPYVPPGTAIKDLNYTTGNPQATDFQKLNEALKEKIAATQQEIALGRPLSDSEKLISKLYADRASGAIKISDAEAKLLELSYNKLGVIDKQNEQEKAVQKAMQDSQDAYDKQISTIDQSIQQTQQQIDTFGLSASAITERTIALLNGSKADKESIGIWGEAIDRIDGLIAKNKEWLQLQRQLESKQVWESYNKDRQSYFDGLDSEILKLKQENDLYGLTETQIAAVNLQRAEETKLKYEAAGGTDAAYLYDLQHEIDLRKQLLGDTSVLEQKKQWTDIFSSIESTAHDTFISIFDSGKSAFDRLRDALKNGLLDLLYQMTIKKFIINIGAAVTGSGVASSALAGVSDASSNASSAFGNTGNLLSIGKTIFTGFQTASIQTGAMFGNAALSVGASPGVASAAFSVGQAVPYVAAAFAAYSIISSLMGSGHKETHAYANTSVGKSLSTINSEITTGRGGGAGGDGLGISSGLSLGANIQALATAFGGTVAKQFTLGTMFNSKYNAYGVNVGHDITHGNFDFTFDASNSKNGSALAFVMAIKKGLVDLDPYLEKIVSRSTITIDNADSAVKALASIQAIYKSLHDLPPVFDAVSNSIKLLTTTGNVKNLQARYAATSTFVDLFYSSEEKLAIQKKQLSSQFSALNLVTPDSAKAFRAMVEGVDTTTKSGIKLYDSLVAIAPAFDTYIKNLTQQGSVLKDVNADLFSNIVSFNDAKARLAAGLSVKPPGFATGGDFSGGLRIVGENGPELEATGAARIFNANQTSHILRGNNTDQSQILNEIAGLLNKLISSNSAENVGINTKLINIAADVKQLNNDGVVVRDVGLDGKTQVVKVQVVA